MSSDGFSGNDNKHASITCSVPDLPFMFDKREGRFKPLRRLRLPAFFKAKQTKSSKPPLTNSRSSRNRFEVAVHCHQNGIVGLGDGGNERVR